MNCIQPRETHPHGTRRTVRRFAWLPVTIWVRVAYGMMTRDERLGWAWLETVQDEWAFDAVGIHNPRDWVHVGASLRTAAGDASPAIRAKSGLDNG